MNQLTKFRLRNAPTSWKFLISGYLMCMGVAYLYSLSHLNLSIGMNPKQISEHYHGPGQAEIVTRASKEQTFSLDEVDEQVMAAPASMGVSLRNVLSEGHFHLFGMASFFFGITLFGLFVGISERLKAVLVFCPYLFIVIDNLSILGTHLWGQGFAYLTAISGAALAINFVSLWMLIFWEIWQGNGGRL